jgi:hypothetical protein
MVDRRIAAGSLHPLHAGVYAVGHARLLPFARVMAAVLACGDDAVASHRTAAWILDLRGAPSGPIDITVPRAGGRARRDIQVHRTRGALETTMCKGIACTTPMQTLVDLAGIVRHDRELKRALERTLELSRFDRTVLDALIARSSGRRGLRLLRHLLTALGDGPPPTAIEIERLFLELVRTFGLPYPVVNGYVGELQVDFHWPAYRLIVETDGGATHGHAIAFHRDRDRDLYLQGLGWRVVRLTWRQVVEEPERVAAVLRRWLPPTDSPRRTELRPRAARGG